MFTLPELPYSYEALEPYIDTETMTIHHDKHHATYVDNLNKALEGNAELNLPIDNLLANLSAVPNDISTKVRNFGGGHANHSFFWTIMCPNKTSDLTQAPSFSEAINATFGSFDQFKEKFTSVAMPHFGSGWAWLTTENAKLEIIDTPNQDSPLSLGKTPILGLDVWEHAYYLKYQNRRAEYVAAWWNVVNWTKVEENFKKSLT